MPVQSLMQISAGVVIRSLQESVCVQVLALQANLPHRYSSLAEEGIFHDMIKQITIPTRQVLELVGRLGKDYSTVLNLDNFAIWMEELEKFTTLVGIREFGHAVWCQSRTCQIYECQFMTTSDNLSVNVFPNWLEVVRGPFGVVTAVYYLEIPTT